MHCTYKKETWRLISQKHYNVWFKMVDVIDNETKEFNEVNESN